MIYDIRRHELRDFTYITSVYKWISAYHLKGHQIGRKVGDLLEIITMGGVYQCPALLACLDTEGKLEGFTTAGHKVEFGFYHNPQSKTGLFGAIECKCVGVEETTAGKGRACQRRLRNGEWFTLDFAGRWMDAKIVQRVTLLTQDRQSARVRLSSFRESRLVGGEVRRTPEKTAGDIVLSAGDDLKLVVDESQNLLHTTPGGNMMTEIPGLIRSCKTIKLDSISSDFCQFSLYNCLPGPQTIEKAKQASLVAMDLRKKVDGCWGKEEVPEHQRRMQFLHVICEFSHWEEKSRNVIDTCIDHNLIVPDAVMIRAFEVFEASFGAARMLDRISKKNYTSDPEVREAVTRVFDDFDGHIFYDLELQSYVRFDCQNGKLSVERI